MFTTFLFFSIGLLSCVDAMANLDYGIEKIIKEYETVVLNLASAAEEAYKGRCNRTDCSFGECSPISCTSALEAEDKTTDFGHVNINLFKDQCQSNCTERAVNFTSSVVQYPVEDVQALADSEFTTEVCWTRELNKVFVERDPRNFEGHVVRWQYIATPTGFYRYYPGSAAIECSIFDPRIRPWYIAATSGPKNVILVLDVSSSMILYDRLARLKTAAKRVLQTLTLFDHVGVVYFANEANYLKVGSERTLFLASRDNVDKMNAKIDNLDFGAYSNFESAFQKTFDLLNDSISLGDTTKCHSIILFMTDGNPTVGERNHLKLREKIRDLNREENDTKKAIVFTFSLGHARNADLLKSIACDSGGIFTTLSSQGDIHQALGQYYYYLQSLVVEDQVEPIWVEPYIDAFGLGNITTLSLALYDKTLQPYRLIGVVGADLLLDDLKAFDPNNYTKIVENLASRGDCSRDKDISPCLLDAIRVANIGDNSSRCSTDVDLNCTKSTETIIGLGCSNYDSKPNFCNSTRESYEEEVCFFGSPIMLSPPCYGVTHFHPSLVDMDIPSSAHIDSPQAILFMLPLLAIISASFNLF